ERVEKFVLFAAQLTHHDESLPSIDVLQDTEQSARRQTFSTQSARNGRSTSLAGSLTIRLWTTSRSEEWIRVGRFCCRSESNSGLKIESNSPEALPSFSDPVENGRIVGVVEGVEQLLLRSRVSSIKPLLRSCASQNDATEKGSSMSSLF
ncbi:hypothetical protein QZM77_38165, partial [Burkholderia cepacia]|nr:hypothetical protein [Burkholderia cepacia]